MPVNLFPAMLAFAPVLQPVQAALFLLLLLAISICDLRWREIPDSLQIVLAATTLLNFSPANLLGVFGALPYLVIALFFGGMEGMGGGDIKLAAATGVVLGLSAGLTASLIGLGCFVLFATIYTAGKRLHGNTEKIGFPVGPFLALGAAAAYFMKMGGFIL